MNRLANSTSPYLRQHAANPVDWYSWGEDALSRAKAEDKPIFLSIGYAACHWCHVMAHESFEDAETAAFMNENFINIKVDREQRPDIDGIYMQAVIAMTGSGGWPMSVFLSPDLKPFYAGTYFPPVKRYNMPSFKDLLAGLANAWKNDRPEIDRVGAQILNHLQYEAAEQKSGAPTAEQLDNIADGIQASYDWALGGWGSAPKFPQPMVLEFLLQHAVTNKREEFLKLIDHCLNAMARGGMYDVVGGGFARYSTDARWLVPHFEKMLYDNALLARAYLHGWQVTRNESQRRVASETLDFIQREMTHPLGGFFSSLDADSEGEEGKFYVWTLDEIRVALGDHADFFEAAYGVTSMGNREGKTVLQRALDDATLAAKLKLDVEAVRAELADSHRRLLSVRATRIRPGTDDKILTAWNGLMLAAFADASKVLENNSYLETAQRNAAFLMKELRPQGKLRRAWREGVVTAEVFLEDYAALILGLLALYQSDFDNQWFAAAHDLADEMLERFSDPQGGFFDTPADAPALLIRPKDIQDNATPCGNSLACEALLMLASLTDGGRYRDATEAALPLIAEFAPRHPLGFARWLSAAERAVRKPRQVAVVGRAGEENFDQMMRELTVKFRPMLVRAGSNLPIPENAPALLHDRPILDSKATAYVCEGFVCRQPTNRLEELVAQLDAE